MLKSESAKLIEAHGWLVMRVRAEDDRADWAYTIGLCQTFQHPELIMFGLPFEKLGQVLNTAGALIREGARFHAGMETDALLVGYRCAFRSVVSAAAGHYMSEAVAYYGDAMPALQCYWPDSDGRYPWSSGASASYRRLQPKLNDDGGESTTIMP